MYLRTALDYNVKGMYVTKTHPLLCMKINSTFHTETLANSITLLMIQQLPNPTWEITHN